MSMQKKQNGNINQVHSQPSIIIYTRIMEETFSNLILLVFLFFVFFRLPNILIKRNVYYYNRSVFM